MCYRCDGFNEVVEIKRPYEYYNIVDQVWKIISEGTMILLEGNCKFEEIKKGSQFLEDTMYHVFQCTSCGQRFSLFVETYHGSGGRWGPLELTDTEYSNENRVIFEREWEKYFLFCSDEFEKLPDELKHSLDDILIANDMKKVILVRLKEHAKQWVRTCIPILNYKKPIDCFETEKGLLMLKSALFTMPD